MIGHGEEAFLGQERNLVSPGGTLHRPQGEMNASDIMRGLPNNRNNRNNLINDEKTIEKIYKN